MIIGGSKKEVINNIKKNIKDNNLNGKVEVNDASLSEEEITNLLGTFYKRKKKISYPIKNFIANEIINYYLKKLNNDITIHNIDNIKNVNSDKGCIITSNHFNPLDTFIIRKLAKKMHKKLYVVIEDTNLAMEGSLGFLMNYSNVIPVSKSPTYLATTFKKELKNILDKGNLVLIYPEEEMWFNYRKVRPFKRGAYQYACMLKVPIISCFTKINDTKEIDNEEFYKTTYDLYILGGITPNDNENIRKAAILMKDKDYTLKVEAYEKYYRKKMDYTFSKTDIAGLRYEA